MIEPGIGRIVHFHHEGAAPGELPHAAMIIGIRDSRCVNLACFTPTGTYYSRLDVPLLQDSDAAPEGTGYAEWMAFQKGQAVKTEAAESSLHPRIAALEDAVDAKFKLLGDWLEPTLKELHDRITGLLNHAGAAKAATPPEQAKPDPNAAQGATADNPEPPAAPIAAQPDANAAATAQPAT